MACCLVACCLVACYLVACSLVACVRCVRFHKKPKVPNTANRRPGAGGLTRSLDLGLTRSLNLLLKT